MKQLPGQMSIFDLIEPEVGEYVTTHGAVICHIMRPGYIGKKVVYDVSRSASWRNISGTTSSIVGDL